MHFSGFKHGGTRGSGLRWVKFKRSDQRRDTEDPLYGCLRGTFWEPCSMSEGDLLTSACINLSLNLLSRRTPFHVSYGSVHKG